MFQILMTIIVLDEEFVDNIDESAGRVNVKDKRSDLVEDTLDEIFHTKFTSSFLINCLLFYLLAEHHSQTYLLARSQTRLGRFHVSCTGYVAFLKKSIYSTTAVQLPALRPVPEVVHYFYGWLLASLLRNDEKVGTDAFVHADRFH